MKIIFLSFLISLSFLVEANDGVYFASGNQLIPIEESEISITKEVLKIEWVENNYLLVSVNYIFNNPEEPKELLVGFEAPSPRGDIDGTPINGRHPFISDFMVNMNGKILPFESSIVRTNNYFKNGQIDNLTEQEAKGQNFNRNDPDFFYVYHFKAKFNKGFNTIHHKYKFKISSTFNTLFEFDYILTAATRWANKRIDDFTLILDLGNYMDYNVKSTFFNGVKNWTGASKFLKGDKMKYSTDKTNPLRIITDTSQITFKTVNFSPKGELSIYKETNMDFLYAKGFDHSKMDIPYNVKNFQNVYKTKNLDSYKVLRNLPFARRGYIFKTPLIQQYYESQDWYKSNPNYQANIDLLSKEEQVWLKELKKRHQ